jgi:FkbM family methyltransferase
MTSELPVVNTRRLFCAVLRSFGADLVCDIGSMNGQDALLFKRRLPWSRVIAFEANPMNFERMRANSALAVGSVGVEPLAICERDGVADFFVVRADHPAQHARRGMSSLYRRAETDQIERVVQVPTARLDSYVSRHASDARRLALWIDVEGKAYEVLDGARGILARVQLIHVEVETRPLIGTDQKIYSEVRALLLESGFTEIASDHALTGGQFNVLYARLPAAPAARAALALDVRLATWRRRFTNLVYRFLPGRVRGLLANRFRVRGSIG